MTTGKRNPPPGNLRRRIRAHQIKSGKPYSAAALAVQAEEERGQQYLADPTVPTALATELREAGFIPLEPLDLAIGDWWCRCARCDEVIQIRPFGHGYQQPGRSPYHLHDKCVERGKAEAEGWTEELLAELDEIAAKVEEERFQEYLLELPDDPDEPRPPWAF